MSGAFGSIKSLFMVKALLCMELKPCSSLHHAGICNGTSQCTVYPNRPISQILQCIRQISHNAVFCNRNVHISVTKYCIVEYLTGALWELFNRSINMQTGLFGYVISSWRHTGTYLPISCRFTTLVLGQSYECPTANKVTLKDIGKLPGSKSQHN